MGGPAQVRQGDSVLTFNFRPDRMRQIVQALGEPGFVCEADLDRTGMVDGEDLTILGANFGGKL